MSSQIQSRLFGVASQLKASHSKVSHTNLVVSILHPQSSQPVPHSRTLWPLATSSRRSVAPPQRQLRHVATLGVDQSFHVPIDVNV